MANVSLKTDFTDGEKLFGQQLNNNFAVIQAALATMNKITWQDDPDDSVVTFRGTTEEINQREIIDGQLLYDTTTGETYIDYGSQRISTGSGNAIYIGTGTPTNPSTQLWINPEESILPINTEVVNSMEGTEANKAPSVASVKTYINDKVQDVYSTDEVKTNEVWIDGKPIYRKIFTGRLADRSVAQINLTGLNCETVYLKNGFLKSDGGLIYTLPYAYNLADIYTTFEMDLNNIKIGNNPSIISSYSRGTYYLIIEYTKTTD
jgi:hypothetical protein